jgi:putative intracellular protease/amidase
MAFINNPTAKALFEHTTKLSDVNMKDYDAILLAGGLGATIDLANNAESTKLVEQCFSAGKPVAALCHGGFAFPWQP